MDRNRWLAIRGNGGSLKKFYRSRERYIHVSAEVKMIPVVSPDTGAVTMQPWVQKPGVSYVRGD